MLIGGKRLDTADEYCIDVVNRCTGASFAQVSHGAAAHVTRPLSEGGWPLVADVKGATSNN